MKKVLLELVILLSIVVAIWLIFSLVLRLPENPSIISVEQESEIGKTIHKNLLTINGFSPLNNPAADSILQDLSDSLSACCPDLKFQYHFIVINSEMINAFALPGGHIAITKGLIKFCETREELLSVIAHEIGHVEKRHTVNRIVKEIGLSLLLSNDKFVGSEVARMLLSQKYNRKQEEEADRFSCLLLQEMGMEPRILATFLRKLNDSENTNLGNFEIISSHPNITKRIKNILEFKENDKKETRNNSIKGFKLDTLKKYCEKDNYSRTK